MLYELAQYAQRQGLTGVPGYSAKQARWAVLLAANGQYSGLTEASQNFPACPDLTQPELVAAGGQHSHFLLDTVDVVTGYGVKGDDPKQMAKQAAKHACFVRLLHEAGAECVPLELCAQALEDPAMTEQIHAELKAHKARPVDKITMRVGEDWVVDLPGWRDWWRRYRVTLSKPQTGGDPMLCLMTGEMVTPASTHKLKIKLARVGGQPSGSVLVGFDKEAFTSFGLEQSANAACSEEAAMIYAAALNDLIAKAPRPRGGALMLHWYDRPVPIEDDPFADLLAEYGDGNSDENQSLIQARALLEAMRTGVRPELTRNRYYVLEVSGSGGRVMVRDWFNDDFVALVESINQWYDDLELVGPYGGANAAPPKFTRLLMRLVNYRPKEKDSDTFDRINKQLAPVLPQLWRVILQGTALPDSVAAYALAYAQSRLLRAGGDGKQRSDNLDRVACAILKAWVQRRTRLNREEGHMGAKLNKEHPSPAYQAGRLLAVLAQVQTAALGDVNAGVVQRYFAAASATPALVIGRLVRNAQFHLQKIDSRGKAVWYERQIAEIMTKFGSEIPATLNLEGQSLFALGYYQQLADMFTRKTDANQATAPTAQPDAQITETAEATAAATQEEN